MSKIYRLLVCAALMSTPVAFAQSIVHHKKHPALERAHQKAYIEGTYSAQYAFEMTYSDNDVQARAMVDPTRPQGERLKVVQPARADWTDDFQDMLVEFDAAPYEEFWCADFLALVGPDARPVVQQGNSMVFAFTPQPGPDDDADDRKFLSEMIAHLTVDQASGAIQKFEMRNRRAFKPVFIAKIKSFRLEAQCKVAPDGRAYVADLSTDLSAKVALKKVEEHERRRIFNLTLRN